MLALKFISVPGNLEPNVQSMVDASSESMAITSRHLAFLNRARNAWEDRLSQESTEWRDLLSDAQAIEHEIEEAEEFRRGGPGFVAALCVRDHIDELDEDDLDWCVKRIQHEVIRNATDPDDITRISKVGILYPDRVCASVVPLLVIHECSNARTLLALALTHPVDEVVTYAFGGVGTFLKDSHKELVLKCAAAAAYRGRLIEQIRDEKAKLPYFQQAHRRNLIDRVIPAVREAIEGGKLDFTGELTSLNFNDWTSSTAIRMILEMFVHHPDWEESQEFYSRVTEWLASVWMYSSQHPYENLTTDYKLESEALRSAAKFVLKLPVEEAQRLCRPLIDSVDANSQKVADFVQNLVIAADGGTDDCFWNLWQDFADKAVNAPWVGQLDSERPHDESFVNRIFLGMLWNADAKHWTRLDGHAQRIDTLAMHLPAVVTCLEAYSRFLYTIGQQSLPGAFKFVAAYFERGDSISIASNSEVIFCLESLVSRFVYSEPHRLKADQKLRDAVLVILDELISAGSSSAYRMRDDFVTPLSSSTK